jgi:hypothetical protein
MAPIIPHPLDPDWKWQEFARQEGSAQGGYHRRWTIGSIVRPPLALVGCEIRRVCASEFFVKLGPIRLRVQRLN